MTRDVFLSFFFLPCYLNMSEWQTVNKKSTKPKNKKASKRNALKEAEQQRIQDEERKRSQVQPTPHPLPLSQT